MLDLDKLDQKMWSMLNGVGFQQLLINKSRRDSTQRIIEAATASAILSAKESEILKEIEEENLERYTTESDIFDVITKCTNLASGETTEQYAKLI